VSALIRLWTPN